MSEHKIILKPFVPSKLSDWMRLKNFISSYHSMPKELQPDLVELKNPKVHWYKAYTKQKKFLGISAYKILSPTYAEITRTILTPSERGKGYGSAVAEAMVSLVRERGFKKVLSIVYTTNLPMLFIRLKQGFLIEGLSRNADAPGVHEYILGKEL